MPVAYISHRVCQLHDMGSSHPECPARLAAIHQQFTQRGLMDELMPLQAPAIDLSLVAKAHPQSMIDHLRALSPLEGKAFIDGDTLMNPHSLEAARRAAGAAVLAVDGVLEQRFKRAFCAVRPPGHHAEAQQAMGFCLFNSIAIAALYALQQAEIERVAIIDFDVHHGNGTVDIFRDDPRVMVCSSFQYPFYPGRLQEIDRAHIINTPLAAGTDGLTYRKAIEQQWLAPLESFAPDLILVSAGFDAHRDDPLGQLALTADDYSWVTRLITDLAHRYSAGRVISLLEGGYNLDALAESCFEHVSTLLTAP